MAVNVLMPRYTLTGFHGQINYYPCVKRYVITRTLQPTKRQIKSLKPAKKDTLKDNVRLQKTGDYHATCAVFRTAYKNTKSTKISYSVYSASICQRNMIGWIQHMVSCSQLLTVMCWRYRTWWCHLSHRDAFRVSPGSRSHECGSSAPRHDH